MSEQDLIQDYADLGVSCGYIGNIWTGPVYDNRSFRIFTKLYTKEGSTVSIEVFDVPRKHVGLWRERIEFDTPENRAKLDKLRDRLQRGELHR